jgi:hypothetical protein
MKLTRRGWVVIALLGALLGWLSGPWSYYDSRGDTRGCTETVTVEDGYAFCDG